jgi:hypothetical protein
MKQLIAIVALLALAGCEQQSSYDRIASVCASEPNPDECKARQAIRVYEDNARDHQKDLDRRIGE